MRTLVHFVSGGARYCVPVEATVAVRTTDGLVPLPAPRPGVAGMLASDHPFPVLSVFGAGRERVLVLEALGVTFGLLVDEVTGLTRTEDSAIGQPPSGQDEALVCGVVAGSDGVVMLADPTMLLKRL